MRHWDEHCPDVETDPHPRPALTANGVTCETCIRMLQDVEVIPVAKDN